MYFISSWASRHVSAARLLIAILHLGLVGMALRLSNQPIQLPQYGYAAVLVASGLLVWIAGIVRGRMQEKRQRYQWQQFRFFATGVCSLLFLIMLFGSTPAFRYQLYGGLNGAFTQPVEKKERPVRENYSDNETFYKDLKGYYSTFSRKELRKELKYQLKSLRQHQAENDPTIYIVLIVVGMLLALLLVASLSCSISCNGNDALGTTLLIVGTVGIIALGVFLIRRVTRRKGEPTEHQEKKEEPATNHQSN